MIGKTISHYRIVEKLGGGGMGIVYRAEDVNLRRYVALKFLPPYLTTDEEAKKRFIQEAQTASSLDHPNICTIYEINETEDGRIYLVMAYYEGETLKKKIGPRPLDQLEAIDIALQIGKGIDKAHQKGIIHRDIKPANIMVTNDEIIKILDFGLARLVGTSELTKSDVTLGTISYISPEQLKGKRVDQRTDIWSFGVVLYEMLNGELPFKGNIDQATIYSILNEAPEPFKINLPIRLQRIILKSLTKKPEERYHDILEVLNDLTPFQEKKITLHKKTQKPSIAVLPFTNMSGDENQEYFCDGMAEEIINALCQVTGLFVVAQTSSFSFKRKQVEIREIGKKLNVEFILEGSVRKSDKFLRITAQLINVADGYHIWSDKYDKTIKDVFSIQEEISLAIVNKLKIKLIEKDKEKLGRRYTENLEAYNLFLMGRFFRNKNTFEDLSKAIDCYKRSINEDPQYSSAYAEMSVCYSLLAIYYYKPNNIVFPEAGVAADKALEIDPSVPEAHHAKGLVELFYNWNWDSAKFEFENSIGLNPDYGFAHSGYAAYFTVIGDLNRAIAEERKLLEQDPLAIMGNLHISLWLLRLNRCGEAREHLRKILELIPNHIWAHWFLGQTYALESKFGKSLKEFEIALELSKGNSTINDTVLAAYGWVLAESGNSKEANRIIKYMERKSKDEFVIPFLFVKLYSVINEKDKAFFWLKKSYEERDIALLMILTDETIDNLRSDPRFIDILRKMNLYKYFKKNN
jgi:serine/threonine protein kinase/Tfp pilus assembly protein PilF